MKAKCRKSRLTGWALIAALSTATAMVCSAETGKERRDQPTQNERGGSAERKGAERPQSEGRETSEGRVVFIAGPVRSDADSKRLQEVIRGVNGVTRVLVERGEQEGTVRLTVLSPNQGAFPQAFNAARNAGFTLRVAEVNGRPAGADTRRGDRGNDEVRPEGKGRFEGDARREGKERREGDFRPEGKNRPEGDYPREGKERREGDFRPEGKNRLEGYSPREGKERREGDFRPEGKGRFEGADGREGKETGRGDANRLTTLLVGPVRSDREAAQLRGLLLRVEGVRDVVLKPGERPNTAVVTLAVTTGEAVTRATRVMQSYRLEVRQLGVRKEGEAGGSDRREGDGKRPEGERAGSDRREGPKER